VQPGRGAGRADHGQRISAAGELAIEHQERQAAEMIAVQVRDNDRAHLTRVKAAALQRGQ